VLNVLKSEGWPRRGRTFSVYLCPVSFRLTLPHHIRPCPQQGIDELIISFVFQIRRVLLICSITGDWSMLISIMIISIADDGRRALAACDGRAPAVSRSRAVTSSAPDRYTVSHAHHDRHAHAPCMPTFRHTDCIALFSRAGLPMHAITVTDVPTSPRP